MTLQPLLRPEGAKLTPCFLKKEQRRNPVQRRAAGVHAAPFHHHDLHISPAQLWLSYHSLMGITSCQGAAELHEMARSGDMEHSLVQRQKRIAVNSLSSAKSRGRVSAGMGKLLQS